MALNHGVVSPIYEGEAVLAERLATAGSGAGLAALIPAGMRACAIKVDEVVGVSGFVTPGMRVDILIAGVPPGASNAGETEVKTLMQNIQVLSAGANLQKDNEGKAQQVQVVNLLVTPEQAETLSLASNQTHIQLVLRNPVDTHLASPPGVDLSQLFGNAPRATPPPAPAAKHEEPRSMVPLPVVPPSEKPSPPVHRIEVLNGTTRTEARFEYSKDGK
jgi:pilus assembly protein CpaB